MKFFGKVLLGITLAMGILSSNALAAEPFRIVYLKYGQKEAEGDTMTITGYLKVEGTNTGRYALVSRAMQARFPLWDVAYGEMVVTPGTTQIGYESGVPHSSYYPEARPYFIDPVTGTGYTTGSTKISNY
ncbi:MULTISPECIES: hypothetical protein [Parageobacillus]|jgi:hypothetical protein|uniref:Uncharacterized protein n=1 Tax=Parageobacillus thermoglucosidasius TaxID=1426 RepID=A0A1B7KSK1_PARTM|nr:MULTISPECIES: hypothetical protein [Parageobacillus]OAT73010.1 hypothetical protein A7K69_19375 [Parageobacillus thermoglucosidasius]BDG45598.1 hypothetical protein PspKH34_01590 [Parageobacillus sp. KH3-4]